MQVFPEYVSSHSKHIQRFKKSIFSKKTILIEITTRGEVQNAFNQGVLDSWGFKRTYILKLKEIKFNKNKV